MDTTACPEGLATDVAFQLREATEPCSTPLAAFWLTLLFVTAIRFAAAMKQGLEWHRANVKLDRRNRKPIAVSLSFMLVIMSLTTIFCIGFNVANAYNGLSWALLSLTLLPYYFQISFTLLRFVALGERIIPLGRQLGVHKGGDQSLRRFNRGGRLLSMWQLSCAVISTIVLAIVSPIDPSHQELHGTIGMAFKAQFQFVVTLGAIYQLRRCVLVVSKMQENILEMKINTSPGALAKTKLSIRKMNIRILVGLVSGIPSGLGWVLLALNVLPRNIWWVYLYPATGETLFAAMLEFVVLHRRARLKAGGETAKPTTSDGSGPAIAMMSSSNAAQQQRHGNVVEADPKSPAVLLGDESQSHANSMQTLAIAHNPAFGTTESMVGSFSQPSTPI